MKSKFMKVCSTALFFLATLTINAFGQHGIGAPEPGKLKVQYFGAFSELPAGAVQPRGWIQKWLERQAQGLTGHPENLCYPYDTCMYAGLIQPPAFHNKWW